MELRRAISVLLMFFTSSFLACAVKAETEISPEDFVRIMSSNAQFLQALEREKIEDYVQAHQLFAHAAQQGHVDAQFSLGASFEFGRGVEQNFELAHYWYEKAAREGNEAAQYFLGNLYTNPQWASLDYQQARYWFQLSAAQGYASAQFALGTLYAEGRGVRQNYSISKEWFGKACDGGDQEGCDNYRRLNIRGF